MEDVLVVLSIEWASSPIVVRAAADPVHSRGDQAELLEDVPGV
jgi:hypothetical protein